MLKGRKVILREKRTEDAHNDYTWRCDPELARLDAAPPLAAPFSWFMASYSEELRYLSSGQRRLAVETLDGKHIGNCMYYDVDEEKKQAELGILIGERDYWDKGCGTDAVTTLVNHIFETTDLERIYLSTLDWNVRAQKCFKKCGFMPCGQLIRGGDNFIVMEIRRSWLEKAQDQTL